MEFLNPGVKRMLPDGQVLYVAPSDDPSGQLRHQIYILEQLLQLLGRTDVPVYGLLCFTQGNIRLLNEAVPYPAATPEQLVERITNMAGKLVLSTEDILRLGNELMARSQDNVRETTVMADSMPVTSQLAAAIEEAEYGLATQLHYEEYGEFSEGYCAVKLNGLWGFINKGFDLVVQTQFERVERFKNGHAAVCVQGRWGFINAELQVVAPPIYEKVGSFYEGLAMARLNGKMGMIDAKGKMIIKIQFEGMIGPLGNVVAGKFNGK